MQSGPDCERGNVTKEFKLGLETETNQCYHTTWKSPSFILLNLKCLDDYPNGIRGSTFVMVEPKRNGTMGRPHVNKGRIFFETVNDFLGECSLHGFKYFPKSRWFIKVFWVSKD